MVVGATSRKQRADLTERARRSPLQGFVKGYAGRPMEISRTHQRVGLILLTLGLLLPFAGKAVHLDDPIFLWTAGQIREAPADFFGFEVNWYGPIESMARVNKNPPLLSFYLALVEWVAGSSEVAMHVGMLLPSIALVLGLYALARSFCREAWLVVLVAITTPVFLVSATSLMADVPMLAFFVGCLVFFVRGLDEDRDLDYWIAGTLLGLGVLTKYSCLALIPLVFVYGLARKRRFGSWVSTLLIGVAIATAYDLYFSARYGFHPLLDVMRFSVEYDSRVEQPFVERAATGLFFLGGCTLGNLFWLPFAWRLRTLAFGVAVGSSIAAGFVMLFVERSPGFEITLQQFVFALAGLHVAGLVGRDFFARRRNADSLLLGLWVLGFIGFATFANWTTNARSILPSVPAIAVLLVRCLEARGELRRTQWIPALSCSLVLAVSVALADSQWASSARLAARELSTSGLLSKGTLYFQGSWGFQHYMEEAGVERVAIGDTRLVAGDRVVIPMNGANVSPPPRGASRLIRTEVFAVSSWIAIMSMQRSAGFYASEWGSLPYSFGRTLPERYGVFEMERGWNPRRGARFRGEQESAGE